MADEITVSGRPIGSLKVPELREELENRGLSTKGVKAVLLERLKEALSEQGKEPEVDEQNPIVAGYLARQEAALAEARKRTESETSGTDQSIQSPTKSSPTKRQTPRRGQKAAPVEVEPEPEPEDVVKDSAESSGNSNAPEEASEQKEEPVPEPVEEPEKPEKPAEVEDVAMEEPEEPAKEPVVVQKSEEEPAPHKAEETEKTDTPKPVEPPVEQQVDKESAKPAIQKEDDSDELDYEDDEEPKEAAKEEVEEKTEQKKEKKPEKDDDDVARTSVEKEEKVRGTVTHRRASSPSSRHPLSNIVHIRGLTRPFTERALRSVIEKHGGEIADFWIDKVKSHCFAKLNSESNAENVLKELNDTIWPDGNPKKLAIVFDTEENMTRYKDGLGEVKLPEAVTIGTLTGASRASRLSSSTSQTSVLGGKTNFQITLQNAVRDNDKLDLERKEKRGSLASRLTRLDDKEIEKQKEKAKEKEKEKEKPKEEKEEKKRRRSETPPFSRGAGFMNEKKLRKDEPDEKRGRRSDSRRDDSRRDERRRADRSEERVEDPEPPKKSMEEIFRKTAAIPPIYYLPLTDEQIAANEAAASKQKAAEPERPSDRLRRPSERTDRSDRDRDRRDADRDRPRRRD